MGVCSPCLLMYVTVIVLSVNPVTRLPHRFVRGLKAVLSGLEFHVVDAEGTFHRESFSSHCLVLPVSSTDTWGGIRSHQGQWLVWMEGYSFGPVAGGPGLPLAEGSSLPCSLAPACKTLGDVSGVGAFFNMQNSTTSTRLATRLSALS